MTLALETLSQDILYLTGLLSSAGQWSWIVWQALSVLASMATAIIIRCTPDRYDRFVTVPGQVMRALLWGTFSVTVTLLGLCGLVRYLNGEGFPSFFALMLCVGLTSLILMGAELEATGNIIFDSVLAAIGLTILCFTAVNGIPALPRVLSRNIIFIWITASVAVGVVMRAQLWAKEGK